MVLVQGSVGYGPVPGCGPVLYPGWLGPDRQTDGAALTCLPSPSLSRYIYRRRQGMSSPHSHNENPPSVPATVLCFLAPFLPPGTPSPRHRPCSRLDNLKLTHRLLVRPASVLPTAFSVICGPVRGPRGTTTWHGSHLPSRTRRVERHRRDYKVPGPFRRKQGKHGIQRHPLRLTLSPTPTLTHHPHAAHGADNN